VMVGSTAMAGTLDAPRDQRATGCERIPGVAASLDQAERRLREGGDGYKGGNEQVRSGLVAAREKLASFQDICTRSGA